MHTHTHTHSVIHTYTHTYIVSHTHTHTVWDTHSVSHTHTHTHTHTQIPPWPRGRSACDSGARWRAGDGRPAVPHWGEGLCVLCVVATPGPGHPCCGDLGLGSAILNIVQQLSVTCRTEEGSVSHFCQSWLLWLRCSDKYNLSILLRERQTDRERERERGRGGGGWGGEGRERKRERERERGGSRNKGKGSVCVPINHGSCVVRS